MAVEIISTVLVAATSTAPAGPYDLTDLATVHDELGVTGNDVSNDPFLSRAITQASTAIANYCNRVFVVEALQDQCFIQQDPYPYQVPGGVDALQLSRWPLWPLVNTVVNLTGNTHGTITVDGIASTAGLVAGQLVFAVDGSIPAGVTIATVSANSITLSAAATSSETGLAINSGIQVIQTLSVGDPQTLIYGQDFTVDAVRGWLIRLNSWTGVNVPWEAEPVTVQYQAGYAAIPVDLTEACLRLVTARFSARGRDPMLMEQTQAQALGSQRYWVGTSPGQRGAFAPEIESMLQAYRVPVC
jgi:hypothetical protein